VEESDNADKKGISDDIADEQKNEEEEKENNETDVIKSTDDSKKEEPKAEDNTESNTEEDPSTAQFNADPAAAEVDAPVSISFRGHDSAATDPEEFLDIDTVASIDPVKGFDNGSTTNGNVEFLVTPKAGWTAASGVSATYTKEDGDQAAITVNNAAGKYSITRPAKGYVGDLTVTVTAAKVKNTLKTNASLTGAYLYGEFEGKGTNPELNTTGIELPFEGLFSEDAQPISIAVPEATAGKNGKVQVAIGDGSAKDLTRVDGTVKVGETDCVLFTFNPYEVDRDKAEEKENTDTNYVLSFTNAAGTAMLTIDADAASEPYYDIKKVDDKYFEDSEEFEYKKLATNNANDAVASLTKDNYQTTGTGDAAKKNLFVFAVAPKTAKDQRVTISKVYAELWVTTEVGVDGKSAKQTIEAEELTYKETQAATETKPAYGIDLSKIDDSLFAANMTLKIKAETAFVSESEYAKGFENHTIEFTGDLDTVNIWVGNDAFANDAALTDAKKLKKNPYENDDTALNFAIQPKTGYAISKGTNYNSVGGNSANTVVTVSYDKVYLFTAQDNSSNIQDDDGQDIKFYVKESEKDEYVVNKGGSDSFYDMDSNLAIGNASYNTALTADQQALAKEQNPRLNGENIMFNNATAFSLKNIKIAVKTELATEKTGQVTVTGITPDMSYDVTGTDISREGDSDRWNIGEDADLLVLTVNSEMKPTVQYETEHADAAETVITWGTAEVTGEGGTYTAKIPVSLLETKTADGKIKAAIRVSKGNKTLHAYKDEDKTADFTGKIKIAAPDSAFPMGTNSYKNAVDYDENENGTDDSVSIVDGSEVTVTLYAEAGSLFDKAYYVFANDKENTKHDLEVNAEKTEATFTVKMTDDVNVLTKTTNTYRYEVTYTQNGSSTNKAVDAGDGVYVIPAGVTSVKVAAFNGPGAGDMQDIYNVRILDGGVQAAATATIAGNVATLTLSNKDGELINLELKGKRNGTKTFDLPSISIRQDKMADQIAVKDDDGNQIESVNVLPGETKGPYTVEVVNGSLDFVNKNIALEITRDASKTGRSSDTVTADVLTVNSDNITATFDTKKKELSITGNEVKKGNDNPVILRFYDVQKRKGGKDESNKLGIIAGSEISVKLDTPEVALVTPTVKANNTVHNLQLTLGAPEIADSDGVYYRVKISGGTVKEPADIVDVDGNTVKAIEDNVQWLPTPYDEGNHSGNSGREIWVKKAAGASQEILIPVNYQADKDGNYKVQEYSLTVELVQKAKGDGAVWSVGESNLIVSPKAELTTKTAEALYPTDLTLDKTTATVYTGQADQKIATATFGDVKGVRQLNTTIVDAKTGAAVGNRWTQYGVDGSLWASADLDGNIYVNTTGMKAGKTLPKNIGVKVSAFAKNANEISKIVTLKFVNGVDDWGGIRFENGNNRVLYRQDGKKVTLKLKAVINEDSGVKAKNQKQITYALGDAEGDAYGEKAYKMSANLQSNVTVNPKNGTVTVSKDYVYKDGDNKFSVIATLAGTDNKAKVYVTISQLAQEKGDIVIIDSTGKVIARDGGTISAETFASKTLYVRALKTTAAQTNNKYGYRDDYVTSYVEGIGFTSGNKKALTISKTTGELKMVGAANGKAVKITAVNTDGSKKVKSTISVTLTGPKAFGIYPNAEGVDGKWNGATKTYQYNGAMKQRFVVRPFIYVNGNPTTIPQEYYKNLKITVKSAKKTEKKDTNGDKYFEIVKSAPVTTITLADKTDKSVAPVTYTIEQSPATPVKGKALKVKTVTKLTETMLNSAKTAAKHDDGKVKITFQITGKDAAAYAGKYIMLTPDYSKKKLVNKIENTEEFRRANSYFLGGDGEEIVKIEADGTFTLELDMWRRAAQERIPGTYKLMAAVGQYGSKGTFEFMEGVKSTTVSVKIPGKAPKKLALETKGDYTLSVAGGTVPLEIGISSAYSWYVSGNSYPNVAKNAVNSDGKVNNFRKYFYVQEVGGRYVLGMNTNVKVADLEALLKDTEGKDCKGFVTITSYNEMGAVETKDMEINVNLVQTGVLTAKANETYLGSKAVVKIYDAEGNALDVYSAGLDKSAAAQTDIKSAKAATDGKSIEVEINDKAGESVSVDLKVLAKGSAFAEADGKQTSDTYLQKWGESVKAEIKLVDPSTATDTVEVLTKEEDLAFAAVRAKQPYDDDYALANDHANKKGYNSYFDTGSSKKYVLRVDVKSKIEGAEVNGAAINKTTADKTVQSILTVAKGKKNNEILLTLDQKKFLQESAKEGATVEKGGTITVPVNVKFTNSKIKEQTVELNVKLPSPITYEEAKAAMTAAQAEIENMQPAEYLGTKTSVASLEERINEAFRKAVPLDAEAIVTPDTISLGAAVDGKYKATVLIKEKSTKQDKDYEHEFVWNEVSETKWDAKMLMDAIKELLSPTGGADNGKWLEGKINALESNKAAGKTVDNSYTADDFVKDLTALLKSEKNVELGKNLIIETTEFKRTRATNSANGLFTIGIRTRDGEDKKTNWNSEANYAKYNTSTTLKISKITNLGDEGTAVSDALDALDYEQLVYEAIEGDFRNLEQNLEDAIRAAAEGALKNKNVTVEFEQILPTSGDDNYVDAFTKKNLAVKLPFEDSGNSDEWTNGYVKFKLLLHQEGTIKDLEIDRTVGKALDKDWKSKKGETFQKLDQIEGVLDANGDETAPDQLLEWTDPVTTQGSEALGKAAFVEKIEITDDWKTKAESKVKSIVGKLVNGMYLTVSVNVTDATKEALATAAKATGTVIIKDDIGRCGAAGTEYSFNFELPVIAAALTEGTKESALGTPKLMTQTDFNATSYVGDGKNAPAYDRLSGLVVGAPEKVNGTTSTVEYKVPLTGTLKYVEGWTGFSASDPDANNGYYAIVSVPIPEDLRKLATADAAKAKNFIQIADDQEIKLVDGNAMKPADGNVIDLVVRVEPTSASDRRVKKGTKSGVRGFKVIVDYNSLNGAGTSTLVSSDTDASTGGVGGETDYALTTYTFDMSEVVLDNSSEAKINVVSGTTDLTAAIAEFSTMGLDAAKMNVSGSNLDGKSAVVKVTGDLTNQTLTGFSSVATNNTGYYMLMTLEAPSYVKKSGSANAELHLVNPNTPKNEDGNTEKDVELTPDANGVYGKEYLLVRVNDAALDGDKNVITIGVDWDGSEGAWTPNTYTLDLSDVTYKVAP